MFLLLLKERTFVILFSEQRHLCYNKLNILDYSSIFSKENHYTADIHPFVLIFIQDGGLCFYPDGSLVSFIGSNGIHSKFC